MREHPSIILDVHADKQSMQNFLFKQNIKSITFVQIDKYEYIAIVLRIAIEIIRLTVEL